LTTVKDSTLKKVVVIGNQKVELHSVDGETWATDVEQIERRRMARERRTEAILNDARRFFRGRLKGLK
jgi:hypothetical protein